MKLNNVKFYIALSSSQIAFGVVIAFLLFAIGGITLLTIYKNQRNSIYRKIGSVMTTISGFFLVIGGVVGLFALIASGLHRDRDRNREIYEDRLTGPVQRYNFVDTGVWANNGEILRDDDFTTFYIKETKYILKTNFEFKNPYDIKKTAAYCYKIPEQNYYCCCNLYKVETDSELEIVCNDNNRIFVPEYSSADFDNYFTEISTVWSYRSNVNGTIKAGNFTEQECEKLTANIDELYELDRLSDLDVNNEEWQEKVFPFSSEINEYEAMVDVYVYTKDKTFYNKNLSFTYVSTETSGCFVLLKNNGESFTGYQYSGGVTDVLETLYAGVY